MCCGVCELLVAGLVVGWWGIWVVEAFLGFWPELVEVGSGRERWRKSCVGRLLIMVGKVVMLFGID